MTDMEAFEHQFNGEIERHRATLVQELRKFIASPVPRGFEILLFEILSDWSEFPVANRVSRETRKVYLEPGLSGQLLQGTELILRGTIDQERFENSGVDTFGIGARLLAEWVGKCWLDAGGEFYSASAYIKHGDRADAFDLRLQKWIGVEEMGFSPEELLQPDETLSKVIGKDPLPQGEILKRVWDYIKKEGLQDQNNARMLNADETLVSVFGGNKQIPMSQMTKYLSLHCPGFKR